MTAPLVMSKPPRSRFVPWLIAAAFLGSFGLAVVLRFGGWQFATRNYGELLQPPLPMFDATAALADGNAWTWVNQDRHWSLLARVPPDCAADCVQRLAMLAQVQTAMGRHADKLSLFAVGALPAGSPERMRGLQLGGALPAPLQTPVAPLPDVWLVDPHGYLVLHYPPGFDPNGLRRDLGRLIK
jgi:hypothetical protein